MSSQSRRERRRAELEGRRDQRRARARQTRDGRSLLLPASIGALVLGVLAVIGFALATAPPPAVQVTDPTVTMPYELADGRALGAADAPLTMEVWSDFQCPACGQLVETVEPRLVSDFVQPGRLRLVYRDFAFLGQESIDAAVSARCAERQGRFWQHHDYLFANQSGENRGAFSGARLDAIAERVGLDMAAYEACTADPQVRQELSADRTAGQQLGVNSTPSLYVAEELISGVPNYDQLTEFLDAALAGVGRAR